jgi:L-histidine Nalpha-methyltransferase / hercynylcysteine S-oxide synthase
MEMSAQTDEFDPSKEAMAFPANGKATSGASKQPKEVKIIDIRQVAVEVNLKEEILAMFHPKQGLRQLPTLLLYDERGLQLFEEV